MPLVPTWQQSPRTRLTLSRRISSKSSSSSLKSSSKSSFTPSASSISIEPSSHLVPRNRCSSTSRSKCSSSRRCATFSANTPSIRQHARPSCGDADENRKPCTSRASQTHPPTLVRQMVALAVVRLIFDGTVHQLVSDRRCAPPRQCPSPSRTHARRLSSPPIPCRGYTSPLEGACSRS